MTTVVITMAGFGQRFRDAGYTVPKYQIVAHGRTLFAWSMLSLQSFIEGGARFVFVVRGADEAGDFIRRQTLALGITSHDIVELDAPTDGQATSAMMAAGAISRHADPMLIYNIDTFVHPRALPREAVRGDGWLPCFKAAGDHWSFAAADEQGRVSAVREKERISDHATIGLYWFSSFDLYAASYESHFQGGAGLVRGERYVAPIYQDLVADGRPVYIHNVPVQDVTPLGTPLEVERFLAGEPPALQTFQGG